MAKTTSIESHITISMYKVVFWMIVLLTKALIDYKKRFLNVKIGWPDSVRNCRIFDNSYLNRTYEGVLPALGTMPLATEFDKKEEILAFILRDSAYKNS